MRETGKEAEKTHCNNVRGSPQVCTLQSTSMFTRKPVPSGSRWGLLPGKRAVPSAPSELHLRKANTFTGFGPALASCATNVNAARFLKHTCPICSSPHAPPPKKTLLKTFRVSSHRGPSRCPLLQMAAKPGGGRAGGAGREGRACGRPAGQSAAPVGKGGLALERAAERSARS